MSSLAQPPCPCRRYPSASGQTRSTAPDQGNGYGFGLASLGRRAQWLGCDTIAVGTYREVSQVASRFDGDIIVLEPWRPFTADVPYAPRIVHTVGRIADLAALGSRDDRPRVALEGLTSMCRHGLSPADLVAATRTSRGVTVEAHALHLPLGEGHVAEVERWLDVAPASRWYLSHVSTDELARLRRAHPDVDLRPRIGTALWLGDRDALSARATVLDVHPVKRGDRVGYRRRRITKDGVLLVVSARELEQLGVARVSYGSQFLSVAVGAVKRAALEVLEKHTHELMSEGLDGVEMRAILKSRAD